MPLTIKFENYEELILFLYNEKSLLFLVGYEMIKKSLSDDIETLYVANLIIGDTEFKIEIKKNDWSRYLRSALTHFENLEEYKTCQNIKDLLDCL